MHDELSLGRDLSAASIRLSPGRSELQIADGMTALMAAEERGDVWRALTGEDEREIGQDVVGCEGSFVRLLRGGCHALRYP